MKIEIKETYFLIDKNQYQKYKNKKLSIRYGWNKTPYINISYKGKSVPLHRLIMNAPKGMLVDHKNRNTLDNRKKNLRLCTRAQNMWNRKATNATSKYKGVTYFKRVGKWIAMITANKNKIYLGIFFKEEDAARAYNKAAKKLHGKFARLNKIGG